MINKQKIIFVSGIYPLFKGGAEYQMRLIADRLKDNYEIIFMYLGDVPGQPVLETHCELIDGYKTYFIKSCTRFDNLTLKFTYGRRIYEIFKKERPDFVYQRVLKFVSYYISKYQVELGYQHFIHVADLFTLQFDRSSLRGRFNYYFFNKTVNNRSKFVVQTGEQEKALLELQVKPILQVYNMHPTLDFSVQPFIEQKLNEEVAHIVWVANIKQIKQLELFISLAAKFKDDSSMHFDVIGSIQDHIYAKPILDRMDKLTNVTHYQGKDNTFVNDFLLNEASLVVNTSVSEGFSNVFIQSWLRGVPILSLNSNPDQLLITYPILGSCVNGDLDELASQLLVLLKKDDYMNRAMQCFEIGNRLFSFENIHRITSLLEKNR